MSLDETRCITPVNEHWGFGHYHQCPRKRGHGPNGLYCKQHDPERIKAEEERKWKAYEAKRKLADERHERISAALRLVEGIPTNEIQNYKVIKK